ncbi:hypothetical protein [Achromobacter xylosoxidans]|uniref:hypothetical protein n=1 Tax=Alcaligenes xylosoxydans xylosoxydans TaxID=85698 RepID=UPI001F0E476A|nr:hypothetical protein [Achromobacter xylosoxidans]MCH4575009.1 hypothetical protein [Achromobacter xylosoxidans]
MLFSPTTCLFYCIEINGENIPPDAVEITKEEHMALLDGQSEGKRIVAGEDGKPVLKEQLPETPEQIQTAKVALVQEHMDAAARALRYDSIANAITYAEEPAVPKFQAEGIAFRAWRSLVWARCYEILAEVEDGERDIPADEELIAELPDLHLPT